MMDQTIKLELTVKEIDAILVAISKMPLCDVIDLFNKIRNTTMSQLSGVQNGNQVDQQGDQKAGGAA